MKLAICLIVLVNTVAAFSPVAPKATRQPTILQESFGLGIGEDTYENQPALLKGEQEYKQFVNKYKEDNMLNRKYNVVGRVRELNLLEATAETGLLAKLEKNGVDLKTIEELLPAIESLGLLSFAASNQQFLVNLVAPLLIEPAPYLLPAVAGALEVGPTAFFLPAAACATLEAILVTSDAQVPLIGLPAGAVLGLVLVPLTVVLGGAGVALSSSKKA